MNEMTEDKLVQETAANYFHTKLHWNYVYAYNAEKFDAGSMLGRKSENEVYLVRHLRDALIKFNPGLPDIAYDTAVRIITETRYERKDIRINKEKYDLFKNGVQVSFKNNAGQIETKRLRIFNFDDAEDNHFLIVREMWIAKVPYRRRPDIIGFVNGVPLLFIELKNVHRDIQRAYNENLSDYKDTIPHLFDANAFIIISNGRAAKLGSITGGYKHFHEWKRLSEEDAGIVDFETLLKGTCSKKNFMDIFENFILFDDQTGKIIKIVARNHQYLGVNRAIENVRNRESLNGQLGVFWHTQGGGKSYSMIFFSQKVHRKIPGNFSFLIVTDRDDLDTQIYKTFAGCGVVDNEKAVCRASSGEHLKQLLKTDRRFMFTIIHKFNQDVDPDNPYTSRGDIIVMSDEAHRTQYGRLAMNMRNALANAHYIGFTGTPLFSNDQITKRIFGDYVSKYGFQRAVDDKTTAPMYYDNRGEKLGITTTDINLQIAEKLENVELDADQQALLEKELSREYHIITAEKRLDAIARDFVEHFSTQWESGKAMFVCIDKITTARMYNLIQKYWNERIKELEAAAAKSAGDQEEIQLKAQLAWVKETEMAVVISEEQGEIKRFEDWGLDIVPHREKIKKGYETPDGKRIDIDDAFKNENHRLRVAIVCAMWLTGFDVPSLSTLYLDKPLKAHTLIQAIARANRIYEGKNNGLIVDYCGILKNLRQSLATYATGNETGGDGGSAGGSGNGNGGGEDGPVRPPEELLRDLEMAIALTENFLKDRGFDLAAVINSPVSSFERIAAIAGAKEVVNKNGETRKRFELMAREVFRKFKACLNMKEVYGYSRRHDAVSIIYRSLQQDRDNADISRIIRELHKVVGNAIDPQEAAEGAEYGGVYDISKIDFERLRQEFAKSPAKNTTVCALNDAIEKRLSKMLERNPLRIDYYERYQKIIAEYNNEKDRVTIEKTFEELMKLISGLDQESRRAIREGLDEEHLALFDLLIKPRLSSKAVDRVKRVASGLLARLKAEKLKIDHWKEKDATRSEVKTFIRDFLWDENTGLPIEEYAHEEVELKAAVVFEHIYRVYEDPAHNIYQDVA